MKKVVVAAPTYGEVRDWCMENGINRDQVIAVLNRSNVSHLLSGVCGIPHVILNYGGFCWQTKSQLRDGLRFAESPPYGGTPPEPADDVPAAVRD